MREDRFFRFCQVISLIESVLVISNSGFAADLSSQPSIDGGKLDSSNRFPATVRLDIWDPEFSKSDYKRTCSGTLIAPRIMLTAAHCLKYMVNSRISKTTINGPHQADSEEGTTQISNYIMTEARLKALKEAKGRSDAEDRLASNDDLAVVVLDQPQALASYPELACEPLTNGTPMAIAGYGFVNQVTQLNDLQGNTTFKIDLLNHVVNSKRYYGYNQAVCPAGRTPDDFIQIRNTLSAVANYTSQNTNHGDSGSGIMSPRSTRIYGVCSGQTEMIRDPGGNLTDDPYFGLFAPVSSASGKSILSLAKKQFPNEMASVKLCP